MTVKPYHFKLDKVSSRQQQLLDAVMSFLPKTGLRESFSKGIDEAMEKHVGELASYQLEAVSEMSHQAYCNQLPAKPLVAVLGCVPVDRKAYLEIDDVIVQVVLERLLGGSLEGTELPRALTDTEQGVLQYLLLQLLAHVYRLCGKEARVHFRFDRFVLDARDMEELARADEEVVLLTFRIEIGDRAGFAKLVLPNPLVESAFLDVSAPGQKREEELVHDLNSLRRFENFRVALWAEAGRTTLKPDELGQLERDDVILFDETDIALGEDKSLGGRALLRLGMGRHGGFLAGISTDKQKIHCRLEQQFKGEKI